VGKHVHILGICGTFMGGVARLARQLGHTVTGVDQNVYPPMSDCLRDWGISILQGYSTEHLNPQPDLVIVGNAISRGNPELEEVMNQQIPYISGPQWVAEQALKDRHVLAVSGTHGKTTISSILAWLLTDAGLNPGYLIGGAANNFEYTADLGTGDYFVIEADEYDSAFHDKRPKFMHYHPSTLIINNIEFDHGDIYDDLEAIKKQFHFVIRTVPNSGLVINPESDVNVQDVLKRGLWSSHQTVGDNDWSGKILSNDGREFEVWRAGENMGKASWQMLGQFNVDNAIAAIAAAHHVGVPVQQSLDALSRFKGIRRRMEYKGEVNNITVYDDFAHHPTAISKALQALRDQVGQQRIFAVVQLGSNTMSHGMHDTNFMAEAFKAADQVVMLRPAGDGWDLKGFINAVASPVHVYNTVDDIMTYLDVELQASDKVLIMSNKGFDNLPQRLVDQLQRQRAV